MLELDPKIIYKLPLEGGYLDIRVAGDEDYPGLDIEFIADGDKGENPSRPRVIIEQPKVDNPEKSVRALIWNDPQSEDYTEEIDFK